MKTIEEFEKEVTQAVEKVKADGWHIISGSFYEKEDKGCCPLTAMLIARGLDFFEMDILEGEYGSDDIYRFWIFFDADAKAACYSNYGLLGKALRKELLPV